MLAWWLQTAVLPLGLLLVLVPLLVPPALPLHARAGLLQWLLPPQLPQLPPCLQVQAWAVQLRASQLLPAPPVQLQSPAWLLLLRRLGTLLPPGGRGTVQRVGRHCLHHLPAVLPLPPLLLAAWLLVMALLALQLLEQPSQLPPWLQQQVPQQRWVLVLARCQACPLLGPRLGLLQGPLLARVLALPAEQQLANPPPATAAQWAAAQ